jgi:hypothetical protein
MRHGAAPRRARTAASMRPRLRRARAARRSPVTPCAGRPRSGVGVRGPSRGSSGSAARAREAGSARRPNSTVSRKPSWPSLEAERLHRAANELARSHLRQVVAIAMKLRRDWVPVSDLVAEDKIGVVQALAKFRPERGVRFGTYAATTPALASLLQPPPGARAWPISAAVAKPPTPRSPNGSEWSIERVRGVLQRLDRRDVSLDARLRPDAGPSARSLSGGRRPGAGAAFATRAGQHQRRTKR